MDDLASSASVIEKCLVRFTVSTNVRTVLNHYSPVHTSANGVSDDIVFFLYAYLMFIYV